MPSGILQMKGLLCLYLQRGGRAGGLVYGATLPPGGRHARWHRLREAARLPPCSENWRDQEKTNRVPRVALPTERPMLLQMAPHT